MYAGAFKVSKNFDENIVFKKIAAIGVDRPHIGTSFAQIAAWKQND